MADSHINMIIPQPKMLCNNMTEIDRDCRIVMESYLFMGFTPVVGLSGILNEVQNIDKMRVHFSPTTYWKLNKISNNIISVRVDCMLFH